jgi:hypothetical protein
MSNQRNNRKSRGSALKLSDTQLVLLSAAAQRDDHCLATTPKLKGCAAYKVSAKLIAAGLVKEIMATARMPVWRRDDETAQSFALKLTAGGLQAIAVEDDATEEEGSELAAERNDPPSQDESSIAAERASSERQPDDQTVGRQPDAAGGIGGSGLAPRPGSKLAEVIDLLRRGQGATIDELIAATNWLPHTTRAALTGLKKRGCEITRNRSDGVTRYTIANSATTPEAPNGNCASAGASASNGDGKAA